MNLLNNLFSRNKNSKIEEKDYAKLISELNGCEYEYIPDAYTVKQITDLYIKEYKAGQVSGYTPVIVAAGSTIHEMIECNYEDNNGSDTYRNALLRLKLSDGHEFLNNRFKEYTSSYNDEE